MYLRIRNFLPILVGGLWLLLTWWLISANDRYSGFEFLTWIAAMFATMILVDRLYCGFVRRRAGVDPMKVHWSRLRNRDAAFFCAACQSIFLLPPEDFSDEGWVHCGDCGHAVAPYGEMKPFLPAYRSGD